MATIIDKRYKGDRSTVNKKKFFIRYRQYLKNQIDHYISKGSLKDVAENKNKKRKVALPQLSEPQFRFSNTSGVYHKVWVNNPRYRVGDKLYFDAEDLMNGSGHEEGDDGTDLLITNE